VRWHTREKMGNPKKTQKKREEIQKVEREKDLGKGNTHDGK